LGKLKKMTNNRSGNKIVVGIILSVSLLTVFLTIDAQARSAQAIDPFYLRMFEAGEAAFVAGDHAKAVKDLELAVFGLGADRIRSAKACVYLALSHSTLKNPDKSSLFLMRAAGLIGKDSPASIGLAGGALNAYERLLQALPAASETKPGEAAAPVWEKPVDAAPPVWEKPKEIAPSPVSKPAVEPSQVKELEGRLGPEPDNDVLRLNLADLYIKRGDHRKAAKLMRDLLKRDPEEIMATFHLSRALYFDKDPGKAIEGFHKIISPASEMKVTKDAILRSTIYIVLCLDRLDQKNSRDSYLDYFERNVPLAELKRLVAEEGLERDWALMTAENK
jgi:tetratricopeptide (TPR) repeat protein